MAFFTIGHSNRSLDDFIGMLLPLAIDQLVDVRAFPRSRTNPDFNIETFPNRLAGQGIAYQHCRDLGGRRNLQKGVPGELNSFWRNQSFHNYADYARSQQFHHALDKLVARGSSNNVAIMCSEAAWWRCHRRIISDYLILRGCTVRHVMAIGRYDVAEPNPGAVFTEDGQVLYPS